MKPTEGDEVEIECDAGENLLEVAQSNDVEIKSTCGGGGTCGECIIVFPKDIFDKLPKPGETEMELLKNANAAPTARLACQVKTCECFGGKVIEVPLHEYLCLLEQRTQTDERRKQTSLIFL